MTPRHALLGCLGLATLLTVASCGAGIKKCSTNEDCGEGAYCENSTCVLAGAPNDAGDTGPDSGVTPADSGVLADAGLDGGAVFQDAGPDAGLEADGGSDAGIDGGNDAGSDAGIDAGYDGGADAGADAGPDGGIDAGFDAGIDAGPICNPDCPVSTSCVSDGGCAARYSSVTLLTPATGSILDGGPTTVLATLDLASGQTRADPSQLVLALLLPDGGSAPPQGLVIADAGRYSGSWAPPCSGTLRLTAAYPDAGLASSQVSVNVDLTPPTFTLNPELELGPQRPADGGFVFADLGGSPSARYWRRDEFAVTEVRSTSTDVDPASVIVAVSANPSGTQATFPVTPITPCDAGYCGMVKVDLWKPPFAAFRGTMDVAVTGRDLVGNQGTSSAKSFLLTRWKWKFRPAIPSPVLWPPALGPTGRIYAAFSGQLATASTIAALEPEGSLTWQDQVPGTQISGNVFVGTPALATPDFVYAVRQTGGLSDYLVRSGDVGGNVWTAIGATPGAPIGPSASLPNPYGSGECWGHLTSSTQAVAVCPPTGFSGSYSHPSTALTQADFGLIANGSKIYIGQQNLVVRSAQLGASGFTVPAGWPVSPVAVGGLMSLATASDLLLVPGASLTGISLSGPGVAWSVGGVGYGAPSAAGRTAFFYVGKGNSDLIQLRIGTTVPANTYVAGKRIVDSPALAASQVYAVATDAVSGNSDLAALTLGVSPQWTLPGLLIKATAPALDCTRLNGTPVPGAPGVLYVGDSTGSVFSFVVDTAGLDPDAQWPKLLHDPRNTNNAATDLTAFACP